MFADTSGILLHFEGTHNHTVNAYGSDLSQDLLFITASDAYISNTISNSELGFQRLINLFYHESVQHGTGLNGHSPYNPNQGGGVGVQENMNSGAYELKEQEIDGLFTRYHFEPGHIRHFQGYETFPQDHLD
jgi:hypothetical protein